MVQVPVELCVSYQKMNQFACPFFFPKPLCNYAVQEIDKEEQYFITVDMYSGYWKVVVEEEAHERLPLFTLGGKRRREVMPMGVLNVGPKFVSIPMKLQMERDTLVKESGLKNTA